MLSPPSLVACISPGQCCYLHVLLTETVKIQSQQQADLKERERVQIPATMIQIKILFFASAREAVSGLAETSIKVKEGCTTNELRKILADQYPRLADMVLNQDILTLALNEEYVATGQDPVLKDGDTVALIPPISGG
jgi:sulfur-carrier protein